MADIDVTQYTIGDNTYHYRDGSMVSELANKVNYTDVEDTLDNTSTMPIQNKAVADAIQDLDDTKLDIADIDDHLDTTSENPVQNQVIAEKLNDIGDYARPISSEELEGHAGIVRVGSTLTMNEVEGTQGFLDVKNPTLITPVTFPEGTETVKIADFIDNYGTIGELRAPQGGGGSGTNVIIDPKTILGNKLLIADYWIDGVKGELWAPAGGNGEALKEEIYTNEGTTATNITLDNDYDKYDLLYFTVIKQAGGETTKVITSIETSKIILGDFIQVMGGSAGADWLIYEVNSKTSFELDNTPSGVYIESIVGVKIGAGDIVTITPSITTGTKIADFEINSVSGELYAPSVDLSTCMIKGTDYVTAGQLSGSTLGSKATAEGTNTVANANSTHAEGYYTSATGFSAHAEGGGVNLVDVKGTIAKGDASHAEGFRTSATGNGSHAEGCGTTLDASIILASGEGSHAEGRGTRSQNTATHAEGCYTTASFNYAHAEGYKTCAHGQESHAEGNLSKALKEGAHAEGFNTTADGTYSHAEGYQTYAKGNSSHAAGFNTTAYSNYQTVIGQYNELDSQGEYAFIVGNGTSTTASNAFGVKWDGTVMINGSPYSPGGGGNVDDVQVDNTSVVDGNGVAHINTMTGAGASAAGTKGLVPAPASGDNEKYLRGDGTWATPSGGGGTTVIANPSGTPTETLTSIQIGNTIYSISGGSGQTVIETVSNDTTQNERIYNENIIIEQV